MRGACAKLRHLLEFDAQDDRSLEWLQCRVGSEGRHLSNQQLVGVVGVALVVKQVIVERFSDAKDHQQLKATLCEQVKEWQFI